MKSIFKFKISLLSFFLICFILACGILDPDDTDRVSNSNFIAEESFSFEVAVANHSRFRLEGINGRVEITGDSRANSVKIEGEKQVGSESFEDAELHLQELEVIVKETADEIFVKTIQPQDTRGRDYVVNYKITLPKVLKVLADNVNGNVSIQSINNDVAVGNVNGTIVLDDIFGSTTVSIVNGQIRGHMTLPLDGSNNMSTVNGNIDLDIPKNTSAEFSSKVVNGEIRLSKLELQNTVSSPTLLRGTLGRGQGTIALSTVNGNINVAGF